MQCVEALIADPPMLRANASAALARFGNLSACG
jgi:hypothetical protein